MAWLSRVRSLTPAKLRIPSRLGSHSQVCRDSCYTPLAQRLLPSMQSAVTGESFCSSGVSLEGAPEPDGALLAALAARRLLAALAALLRVPAAHAAALVAAGHLPPNSPAAAAVAAPLSLPLINGEIRGLHAQTARTSQALCSMVSNALWEADTRCAQTAVNNTFDKHPLP